jgi:4'-phosphopantetheinyl transferase
MPQLKIHWNKTGDGWGIWRIDEDEQYFTSQLPLIDVCPGELTNRFKRLEWLGGRFLLRMLLMEAGQVYEGIKKTEAGKPFPVNSHYQISLTNSYPYVAAQIHPHEPVGIDLEKLRSNLFQVARRILTQTEYQDAGTDLKKLCVYWSAKESLLKISGNNRLKFSEDLKIEPFVLQKSGVINCLVRHQESLNPVSINYFVMDEFILTTTHTRS